MRTLHQTFSNSKQVLSWKDHLVNFNVRVEISQEQGPAVRHGVRGVGAGGVVPQPHTGEPLALSPRLLGVEKKVSGGADCDLGPAVREGSLSLGLS